MRLPPILIEASGALCPIGAGARQIAASLRAGLSQFRRCAILDPRAEPVRLSLVPDEALPELLPAVSAAPLGNRHRRILQLAASALRQLTGGSDRFRQVPLFLGLPRQPAEDSGVPAELILDLLGQQSQASFNVAQSKVFAAGRAAGLIALDAAMRWLRETRAPAVIVGGVDTYFDPWLLEQLSIEGRILGDDVMDGFIPSEGAAFVSLTSSKPLRGSTMVSAAGTAKDPGHRYSDKPHTGEALSAALDRLVAAASRKLEPVRMVFAGLNGESFGVKEWSVARVRHGDLFVPEARVFTPADCIGDAGAAAGALLLAVAAEFLEGGHAPGPILLWASSDDADRGAAYLEKGT
jgi:3-oxoacyl-[acyl-carrier-protein] synthase-1